MTGRSSWCGKRVSDMTDDELRALAGATVIGTPGEMTSVAEVYADLRQLIADCSDDERGVIALMPFAAGLDQLFHEKYGLPLPDEE